MPQLWFGSDHTGNNQTTLADGWISVTIPRPTARQDMSGKRPFIVKKIGWKTCAAPSQGQKMYARISNADGSVYDNSYIGNTISWQKAAATTYEFQSINMHFADDGGTKIRAWLVSGGPFLFSRNTGASGSIQASGGKTYAGTPVGYVYYVQTALPPTGLTVARDAKDSNKTHITFKQYDVKKAADLAAVGDSTSVSGYVVQVARDAAFTQSVKYVYASKGTADVFGLYAAYDWYFRIATRNEVSEHYSLKGGIWSSAVLLAGSAPATNTPPADTGVGDGTPDPSSGTDTDNGGSLGGNNPGTTSGNSGSTTVLTGNSSKVKARIDQVNQDIAALVRATGEARKNPTAVTWQAVRDQINALESDARYIIGRGNASTVTAWTRANATLERTETAVSDAKSNASGAQKLEDKLDALIAQAKSDVTDLYNAVVAAKAKPTKTAWGKVGDRSRDLGKTATKIASTATNPAAVKAWGAAFKAADAADSAGGAAEKSGTAGSYEKARVAALTARQAARSAMDLVPERSVSYSAAYAAVQTAIDAVKSAIGSTTYDTTTSGGSSGGSGGSSGSGGSGGTVGGGSGPVTGGGTDGSEPTGGTGGTPIVYTPIPDTTALRTPKGGLLLSRASPTAPGHTVFLMDRGGRQRIAQFSGLTSVQWGRIRDDQSTARIVLDGTAIAQNERVLEQVSVGRHELCIYRGEERVWEGPITLGTWQRDQVAFDAKDITHYLNRTVMRGGYSNAYPNVDYVVSRIAGIIVSELARKESLDPPVNILPFLHAYVEEGDARTSRATFPAEMTVWQHLDDLAAKAGIDYTVIGRSLHIWDTSRAALGRTRTVTELDFTGDTYISAYGMELATTSYVTDGQGNFGVAGGPDDYYGEVELVATAYDENSNPVNSDDTDPTNDTVDISEMIDQAERNLKGRNPTPIGIHVPDGSGFRLDRGLGPDILLPGVYVPLSATLSGKTVNQMLKLKALSVVQDSSGENATVTLTPASDSDFDPDAAGTDDALGSI